MDVEILIITHREPTHPGEMLREEFLKPMSISQKKLAKSFGTSPEFWLNLQQKYELYCTQQIEREILKEIKPRRRVS